jgi:hypothetical protein
VYVDDLNIISTKLDINEAQGHLKTEFKMKDLGKTKFFFSLQLEHLPTAFSYTNWFMHRKYWRIQYG